MRTESEPKPKIPQKKERRAIMRALSLFTQLGLSMAVCVLLCVAAGKWIDDRLGTKPCFLFIFAVIGMVAALKVIMDITAKEEEKRND
jgi:F0F1-type ATP synthase assembly protein I